MKTPKQKLIEWCDDQLFLERVEDADCEDSVRFRFEGTDFYIIPSDEFKQTYATTLGGTIEIEQSLCVTTKAQILTIKKWLKND